MRKQYLCTAIVTILLGLITINNSNNASALSYSSSVGVGFTFNPTLSVSLSSSDLVISNLVPGSTLDSNVINVSVASNASYGYTLSAIVNGNNSDLTHTNNSINNSNSNSTFSSIATNADLSDLEDSEDTNIWGYSYKDNTVVSPTWSNYNGLSSSNDTTLINTNSNVSSNLDFKIGAKASSTQVSGTYTGTINFTAVTKHIPVTLAEAYALEGKTMVNGFYTMQDMTSTICSKVEAIGAQLQVLDKRDNKLYWISKLADQKCWMTQNLDLDLDSNRIYTHWDTDLGWNDPNNPDINATYQPIRSTINFTGTNIPEWTNDNTEPYSANPGDTYYYTSNSDANDIQYNSLQECVNAGHNDCAHYHAGNYYNWSAAVASNNTNDIVSGNVPNSICPTGWKLPDNNSADFRYLANLYDITTNTPLKLRDQPLWFTRSGYVKNTTLSFRSSYGFYWSGTARSGANSYHLYFYSSSYNASFFYYDRYYGFSVRCLAR